MNNGNNPAHPLTGEAYTNFASYDVKSQFTSYDPQCQGLTKREAFAMAAMQGMIASGICTPPQDQTIHHMTSMASVSYADALLKELAK